MTDLLSKVITAINLEAGKGPQDLLTDNLYKHVAKHVKLSRKQYDNLILKNTIPYTETAQNRSALFTKSKQGHISFHKSTEKELRPFVCLSITKLPIANTPAIIAATKNLYPNFTTADRLKQKNIGGDQDFIDQTIRNILTSNYRHNTNNSLFTRSGDKRSYTFSLTDAGKALAEHALTVLITERKNLFTDTSSQVSISSNQDIYSDEELEQLSKKQYRYNPTSNKSPNRRDTDDKLLKTVILKNKCKCVLNPEHITFAGANSLPNYLEGHHLIPLAAQPSFPDINLDRIENIIPLCPNCHQALHHGTLSVRKDLLTQLQAKYSKGLLSLGFSDDDIRLLLWRYYLCEK